MRLQSPNPTHICAASSAAAQRPELRLATIGSHNLGIATIADGSRFRGGPYTASPFIEKPFDHRVLLSDCRFEFKIASHRGIETRIPENGNLICATPYADRLTMILDVLTSPPSGDPPHCTPIRGDARRVTSTLKSAVKRYRGFRDAVG